MVRPSPFARLSRRSALSLAGVGAAALGLGANTVTRRSALAQQAPQLPSRLGEIVRVATDVYEWTFSGYNSIAIDTDDGIIASDPCSGGPNPRASALYRQTIETVLNKPVKYVVYSHEHADHNTGGSVFAGAEFISHKLAAPKIAARNDPRSPVPTTTFDDRMDLDVGGKHLELVYTGRNHSDNSLVLLYPERELAFAVDFIPVNSLPFRTLADDYPDEWVNSLKWIEENLRFSTLIPGHGALGSMKNVTEVRGYFLDLFEAIKAARAKGLADNSEDMVASVRADLQAKYSTWGNFGPFLPENIQGVITKIGDKL